MIVYFVRHGTTEYNVRGVHQPLSVPLSEKGRSEAKKVGVYLADKKIEKLISSDLTRARETAEIISGSINMPVEQTDLLQEIRRPSSILGTSHYHPKTFYYVLSMLAHKNSKDWQFEDAESLSDIHERADRAGDWLRELSKQHEAIAVVSHTIFLEILMANLCKDGVLTLRDYLPIFSPFSLLKNGSVSVFSCVPNTAPNTCAWEQKSFNKTTHLE